jgi:hypothetical protein
MDDIPCSGFCVLMVCAAVLVTKKTPEDGSVKSRNICRVLLKCFKELYSFYNKKCIQLVFLNSDTIDTSPYVAYLNATVYM